MCEAGRPEFEAYVGIDYSGAKTPTCSLAGLRVYRAEREGEPVEVQPPPSPRKYWTRRGIAEWLVAELSGKRRVLVGIDHGFSFPEEYFAAHGLARDWDAFLVDFQRHWPTDGDHFFVDLVRDRASPGGLARGGRTKWRREAERRAGAKSVFHFDVPGSVAKSTHAGLPWLLRLREVLGAKLFCWPFDGWRPPRDRSVLVEAYPSLWRAQFAREERTADQHDAFVVAARMREADARGALAGWFEPELTPEERERARYEGWILGVG